MDDTIEISKVQLTEWAESLLHMNHPDTLIQRELPKGNLTCTAKLTERARKRPWKMLNEMFELGAENQKQGFLMVTKPWLGKESKTKNYQENFVI